MNEIIKVPQSLDELERTGRLLAMSGYFDAKGTSEMAIAQVCTKILAGREMGYGPFASVQGIHIIQGRPAVSANLMAAAVKAHPAYDYRVRQMDDKACSIEFFQRVDGKWESLGSSAFTADDARKAQTKNMDKFPRNMLFARAMSNGVKWFCPDVFAGNAVYVPEELGATVDGEGNVIDVDHRSVDKATGEVLSTTTPQSTPTGNSNGNMPSVTIVTAHADNPFDDDVPEVVRGWATPADAQAWAVEIGASENEHAARNAFKAVVERVASDGKLTRQNMMAVFTVYYHDRMKRAQEKGQAAIADVTLTNVPEMAH